MFRKILFQYSNTPTEVNALLCTLELAKFCGANVTVLATYSPIPNKFNQYAATLEDGLIASIKQKVSEAQTKSRIAESDVAIQIKIYSSEHPFLSTVKESLTYAFDLVTKELVKGGQQNTICSDDMSLLRKCPTPVFLFQDKCKPISKSNIYTAIKADAEMDEKDEEHMNYLFQLGHFLTGITKTSTNVVSCYDTEAFELLNSLSLSRLEADTITQALRTLKRTHFSLVNELINRYEASRIQFKQLNGLPNQQIPQFVSREGVDCLVIGTTSRSSIAGYLMGSIAEDVINESDCSIFTVKPPGFWTPVTPF